MLEATVSRLPLIALNALGLLTHRPATGVSRAKGLKFDESVLECLRDPFSSGDTPWNTLRTPPFSGPLSGTLPGTLRARRARETPIAGRVVRNSWALVPRHFGQPN